MREAMEGILIEVGFADAVIVKETPNRWDLRQEMLGKRTISVDVVDVTAEEAEKIAEHYRSPCRHGWPR